MYILADFSPSTIFHLNPYCKALHTVPLFRENSQEICEKKQWIYRINPQEERWQLIYSGQVHLRILPKIRPNWAFFPRLEKLAEQYCLTVEGKPNLLAGKNTLTWKSDEICAIINSLEPSKIFSNIDNLSFLQAFLSQKETKVILNDEKVQVSLRELLHKAFAKLGIAELQKDKILPFVKKLVELLSPKNRYAIAKFDANEPTAVHNVLNELYALNLDLLLIYEIFEPASQPSQAILKPEQAVKVLTCLSNILKEDISIYICNLIKQVLSKFDFPLIIIDKLAEKSLFPGYKYREKKTYLWSYAKLCESRSKNLLFTGKYNTIAAALNEAIPDYDFIFIEEDLASILNKIPSMKGGVA